MSAPIGFVGLGSMGLPMAARLVRAGHPVLGCDLLPEAAAEFRALGGATLATPREVADRCAVVLVSLPTPAAVEAVATGTDGLLLGSRIALYVDLSTTGPQVAKRVAQALAARGIVAFDAPVSGGVAGAEQGSLSIMVAGPKASLADVEPLLRCMGKIFFIGEQPGMGHLLKLINNLLSTTALAATYEALTLGVKGGLDPQMMVDVLRVSTGTNHAIESKIPNYVLPGRPMGFALDLSYKDVSLCVEAGEALQVPMRFGSQTRDIWREAIAKIGPKQDYLQVVRLFEASAGVRLAGTAAPKA